MEKRIDTFLISPKYDKRMSAWKYCVGEKCTYIPTSIIKEDVNMTFLEETLYDIGILFQTDDII